MGIDRNNYEIFFLDYFDGTLAPARVEELMAFLAAEPDLKAEFDEFEMVSLQGLDEVVFEGKASLKRGEVTPDNYEWYFAAYAEGDLKPEEVAAVETFAASNPQMQRELHLMMKTRLQAEPSIVFPEKDSLKRRKVIPLYTQMMRYGAAAAVILLMATVFFFRGPQLDTSGLADHIEVPRQETPVDAEPSETPSVMPAESEPGVSATAETTPTIVPSRRTAPDQSSTPPSRILQPVLLAGRLNARPARPVTAQPLPEVNLEQRTEYAYWHLRNRGEEYPDETETPAISLFQLAYDGIQRNLPEDIRRVEQQISENRPNLLFGLASASLVGLNNLLGSPVTIESERDENGRLVQLAVGNAFEITRK